MTSSCCWSTECTIHTERYKRTKRVHLCVHEWRESYCAYTVASVMNRENFVFKNSHTPWVGQTRKNFTRVQLSNTRVWKVNMEELQRPCCILKLPVFTALYGKQPWRRTGMWQRSPWLMRSIMPWPLVEKVLDKNIYFVCLIFVVFGDLWKNFCNKNFPILR